MCFIGEEACFFKKAAKDKEKPSFEKATDPAEIINLVEFLLAFGGAAVCALEEEPNRFRICLTGGVVGMAVGAMIGIIYYDGFTLLFKLYIQRRWKKQTCTEQTEYWLFCSWNFYLCLDSSCLRKGVFDLWKRILYNRGRIIMTNISKSNKIGKIQFSRAAVAELAGNIVSQVYGVVGLVNKKDFAKPLLELLKKEDFSDGVSVKKVKDGYEVSLYVVLSKNVKINAVVYEIQKQVSYSLEKTFSIPFKTVNVFVLGIR